MKHIKQHNISEASKWLETGKKKKDVYDPETDSYKIKEVPDRMKLDTTSKYKILKFIFDAGSTGRRYTDIVKHIIEVLRKSNKEKYDWKIHRGYWATALNGTGDSRWRPEQEAGLLHKYCKKKEDGNKGWVIQNKELLNHFSRKKATDLKWDEDEIELYDELGILPNMVEKDKEE